MKIQIASDLHLEMRRGRLPAPGEFRAAAERDVLVLAGDIGTHMCAWDFVRQQLELSPVVCVPGNHEYYSLQTRQHTDSEWKRKANEHAGLHYLLAEGVTIAGVRFWGAPWYSDLFGRRDSAMMEGVREQVNDFEAQYDDLGQWSVARHLNEHARQTRLLRQQAGSVDVVVTHWPPIRHAIAPRFEGDELNGHFVNDREDLVREVGAQYWISGHVHDPFECVVGDTQCIGNPTGYPRQFRRGPKYKPDRVIEAHRPAAGQEPAGAPLP